MAMAQLLKRMRRDSIPVHGFRRTFGDCPLQRVRPVAGRPSSCLFEALEPLKAAPDALDPARVLRLCGTVNNKSGTPIRELVTRSIPACAGEPKSN